MVMSNSGCEATRRMPRRAARAVLAAALTAGLCVAATPAMGEPGLQAADPPASASPLAGDASGVQEPAISYENVFGPVLEEAQARAVETNQDKSTYLLYDIDQDGMQELFVHFGRFQLGQRYEVYAVDAAGTAPRARLIGSWETDGPSGVLILADGSLVATSLGSEFDDGGHLVAAYFGRLEKAGMALVATPIPAGLGDPMYDGSVQMGSVASPVFFVAENDYNPSDETVERHYVDPAPLIELGDLPISGDADVADAAGVTRAGEFRDGETRRYRRADGSLVRDALVDTGEAKYLFDADGNMVFGRGKVFGTWCEFDEKTGAMIG